MSFPLTVHQRLILVSAEILGPFGTATLNMGLDTGASKTLITLTRLAHVGYDPSQAMGTAVISTAGGSVTAPVILAYRVSALGVDRVPLAVLAFDLPGKPGIDGLLGLDFFQGLTLTLDFRNAQITLT